MSEQGLAERIEAWVDANAHPVKYKPLKRFAAEVRMMAQEREAYENAARYWKSRCKGEDLCERGERHLHDALRDLDGGE